MAAQSDELILTIKRVLPAEPLVVYGGFNNPSQLGEVVGPAELTASMEFNHVSRPAGSRCSHRSRDFHLTGTFREVDPPTRLAYTFVWEDPDPDDVQTLVGLSVRDLGGSTEVALTQGLFKTEARRELHRDGWTDSFDKLEHLVSVRA